MVLDTSAIVAILAAESGADALLDTIERDARRLVSAGTVIESALVLLGRYGERGERELDGFLRAIGAEVVSVGEEQAIVAREAARRFGRGRHRAGLNFGDLFAYALAVTRAEPLLFVGDDFVYTDVPRV